MAPAMMAPSNIPGCPCVNMMSLRAAQPQGMAGTVRYPSYPA